MKILPNNVAVIEGDTHHAVWCETQGLVHDVWMAKQIREAIQTKGIRVCIDGGANIGTLTKPMLDTGAMVIAFEPNPEAAACLRHNCPCATVHEIGLSYFGGQAALAPCDNAGARHLTKTKEAEGATIVAVMPLDVYGYKAGLIKLDVEGHELEALRGAKETIARNRPVIIAEINQGALHRNNRTPQDVFAFLGAYGYKWKIMQPDCKPGDPQYDIIAYPL